MFKNLGIAKGLIVFTSLLSLLTSVVYTVYYSSKIKEQEIKAIDKMMISCAIGVEHILEPSFYDRAKNADSISKKEYYENMVRLASFAKDNELSCVYTLVLVDGKVYFTSSSATDEQLHKHTYKPYFSEYKCDSNVVLNVFKTYQMSFYNPSDKLCHFKSVFIPFKSDGGKICVAAVDFDTCELENRVDETLNTSALMGIGIFIFSLLLSVLISYLITAPLSKMTFIANQLSLGKDLDKEIQISSFRELDVLSRALDRLRTSMNFAMKQISRKE